MQGQKKILQFTAAMKDSCTMKNKTKHLNTLKTEHFITLNSLIIKCFGDSTQVLIFIPYYVCIFHWYLRLHTNLQNTLSCLDTGNNPYYAMFL